jgi:2-polyprenyl-3-methyl-5-hydroxy-6-metoxy-1,4-benzoquinol methylase
VPVKQDLSVSCPICRGEVQVDFMVIAQAPVHCNLLWTSKAAAQAAPRGEIRLCFCPDCGHIFNRAFEPEKMEYTQSYENSLHFSPRFQEYATSLAAELVERHGLYGKDVIEIGSGQGDFLTMLVEGGVNRGIGFDPSYIPTAERQHDSITMVQDFYSEKYAGQSADFICSRHVLEHIFQPDDFLHSIRQVIADRREMVVFFEVPNVMYTVGELGIWDIIYEHYSYFSRHSLARLFGQNGFRVLDVRETFNGQFLTIEAVPIGYPSNEALPHIIGLDQMAGDVASFGENYRAKLNAWKQRLQTMADKGQRIVVWGAGSKGVSFLNALKADTSIEYVVDINPRKRGMFVAGTGQQIVPPEFLKSYLPESVVIMNGNYKEEIRASLNALGLGAEILIA